MSEIVTVGSIWRRMCCRRVGLMLPGAQGGDAGAIHALRGTRQGDLLVPVSRGLMRVEDRGIAAEAYRTLILDRIAAFKAAIAAPVAA